MCVSTHAGNPPMVLPGDIHAKPQALKVVCDSPTKPVEKCMGNWASGIMASVVAQALNFPKQSASAKGAKE